MSKVSLAAIVKHATGFCARVKSATTTARPTACRWKTPARSRVSRRRLTPVSPRSNLPSPPRRICSSCITDYFGVRRIRGRGKNTNCFNGSSKAISPFTVRTCRSTHIPGSATTRGSAAALGLKNLKPFFASHGQTIGFKAQTNISRAGLAQKIGRATGAPPTIIPGGNEICKRIGIVTGGAGGDLQQAASEGVDTFITGEGPHWTYALAEELGLNVFYGGHYATETFGVKALAAELSKRFNLPWVFIDHPTGL